MWCSMISTSPARPPRHIEMTSIISPEVDSALPLTTSMYLNAPEAPMKIVLSPHAATMMS